MKKIDLIWDGFVTMLAYPIIRDYTGSKELPWYSNKISLVMTTGLFVCRVVFGLLMNSECDLLCSKMHDYYYKLLGASNLEPVFKLPCENSINFDDYWKGN